MGVPVQVLTGEQNKKSGRIGRSEVRIPTMPISNPRRAENRSPSRRNSDRHHLGTLIGIARNPQEGH